MTSISIFKSKLESSLAVQWLRLPFTARSVGPIAGPGTKMLHVEWCGQTQTKTKVHSCYGFIKKKKSKLFVEEQYDTETELKKY